MKTRICLSLWFALLMVSCSRPDISTEGLGQPCQADADCKTGQSCLEGNPINPNGCGIKCKAHGDCPEGYSCAIPPLLPDSIAYVCDKD